MIVMKFGGSSLANAERIRSAASIVKNGRDRNPIVVLSAMGDTTDDLLAAANEAMNGRVAAADIRNLHKKTAEELGVPFAELDSLLKELEILLTGISMLKEFSPRSSDYLVSFGERLSVRLMAAYLTKEGVPARFYDAWDCGMTSDSRFTSADLLPETTDALRRAFLPYKASLPEEALPVPVVTGFIAKDTHGSITTLGRGGSDLSATVIGAALQAEEIQTWKDVDGILTADPRIVPEARTVPMITYEEAAELAYFGAQVLHPRSMRPCLKSGTPVRVKNSYNPQASGSLIVPWYTEAPQSDVRAITVKKNVAVIDIESTRMVGQHGFLARVFDVFEKRKVSVDVVATSEVSISLTVDAIETISVLRHDLEKIAEVRIREQRAIVTLICDTAKSSKILAKAFAALERANITVQMLSQSASRVNITMICGDDEADTAVRSLHAACFGGKQ